MPRHLQSIRLGMVDMLHLRKMLCLLDSLYMVRLFRHLFVLPDTSYIFR